MTKSRAKSLVRKTNNVLKNAGRIANDLDRISGGQLIKYNPYGQMAAKASNYLAKGLDYFDALLPMEGYTNHPQIAGGASAGVSQTLSIARTKPRITGSRGSIRITHKELVGTVTMVNGLLATSPTNSEGESSYHVSPTNSNLFPWLATIGGSYDYFKFNRVRLAYVPLCSTATTGRVMLGFDPDATDALPFDRSGLSSYSNSVDTSAWGVAKLDCQLPNNQPWYQTNQVSTTALYSTTTQGAVFWATWGSTAATAEVGELYILYDVTLKDPQPSAALNTRISGTGATVTRTSNVSDGFTVSSTANSVVVTFLRAGLFFTNLTAASTAVAAPSKSGACADLGNYFVTDGAKTFSSMLIQVTGGAYSASSGAITGGAVLTFNTLTALGAWNLQVVPAWSQLVYP